VVGIAGPNGAGKSTLISLLMGFLNPTAGSVRIDGSAPRRWVEAHGVGYLTELVNLPPRWKVPQALERLANLAGVPAATRRARVDELMSELGLVEHASKQVRQLSKGNLQRLGLAQALAGDADVVVLDEPTHGLDPLWTQRFRDVVVKLRRPDRLIVIASHNLDELERLADRVAILNKGRLQRVVEHSAMTASPASLAWRVVFEGDVPFDGTLVMAQRVDGRPGTWVVEASRAEMSAALARLLSTGAVLVECVPAESGLANAFRAAVQE
jgi:ABC-type multidrug transport system ATPase subunit